MIFYKAIIEDNLTYKKALNKAKKLKLGIKKDNDDSVHIIIDDIYYVVNTDRTIIKNAEEIKKSRDKWSIVTPTNRLFNLIEIKK